MIEILEAGPGTSVQDLGRTGYAAWGIAPSGAADRASLRLANRLVGNAEGAAVIEVLLGGLTVRAAIGALIAVTGAPATVLLDRTRAGRRDGPQWVPAGATLSLTSPPEQLRSYIAVRGGLDTAEVLGSRSVDESSGIGRGLRPGDVLEVGSHTAGPPLIDQAPRAGSPAGPLELHGIAGPRENWFTPDTLATFTTRPYAVTPAADRVGVRLTGPPLRRAVTREMWSEPTLRGAVEVPADGLPIVFGPDHPTTCGYPVVAVLDPASADLISQCRPGQSVIFRLRRPSVRMWASPRPLGELAP
jgi:biotin-dependent carboxylase-like uncharacterized protein